MQSETTHVSSGEAGLTLPMCTLFKVLYPAGFAWFCVWITQP